MAGKQVLSVGQCFADHSAISQTLERHFGADVRAANTLAEAIAQLQREHFDLVLVNRVCDADGSAGLDLIKQVKTADSLRHVPIMLVSNYEHAQREAVEAGAAPGFGKTSLGQPGMLGLLKDYLG
jgi:CheY-like chemotaxis protein